ncbi:MAG: glycoside hydrolase family 127 protein [Bacteroidales bacterium]|nr:glycoside hydrolase family 127 protein [Bacteroidales bacterium]
MRNLYILFVGSVFMVSCTKDQTTHKDYPVQPVSFNNVTLTDNFWLPRLETNRKVTIPYDFKKCEETSRIDNFAIAGGLKKGSFKGIRYNDSDVFKVMEAAAYSLSTYPDPDLETYMDSLISFVAAAQEDDGYLFTARTINPDTSISNAGEERWSFLQQSHELYNIGHMYEAAVAWYQATGKRNFLDIALKSADLVCKTFGPDKEQIHNVPGHQEIEIGLVKLYRISGEKKYLDMAKYFLDQRGDTTNRTLYTYNFGSHKSMYTQDHQPVIQQCEAVGHAVRAGYMYSAMADIAALTDDQDYFISVGKLWENVANKKTYITGGIGSLHSGEAFGDDYYLPNLSAYNETCAAIANMLWNQRMFLLTGESKYIDVLERTLYNGFLSGVSLEGDRFFYPNPLESDGSHARAPWFNCSCCPTNVARFLPSLPGYIYAFQDNTLFVNLFIDSESNIKTESGNIFFSQKTNYPWKGDVEIKVISDTENEMILAVRIPGWAQNNPLPGNLYSFKDQPKGKIEITIDGEPINYTVVRGYALIKRNWKNGTEVRVSIPMEVRKIHANKLVADNKGRMAIGRGPLVYCAEWVDNGGKARNLLVDPDIKFNAEFIPDLLNGLMVLDGDGYSVSLDQNKELIKKEQKLVMIPYYAWAHRGNGEMLVWLPYQEEAARPQPPPTIASESRVTASYIHDHLSALNDQVNPRNSSDHVIPRFTFWSHKGTKEWVQYDFKEKTSIAYIHVYWFDDGPNGGCRIPESWNALYLKDGEWKEVSKHGNYPVKKDVLNTIEISPVTTSAVKLEIQLQEGYSGGILEWKIE